MSDVVFKFGLAFIVHGDNPCIVEKNAVLTCVKNAMDGIIKSGGKAYMLWYNELFTPSEADGGDIKYTTRGEFRHSNYTHGTNITLDKQLEWMSDD